jgi:hypothetical protein
MPTPPLDPKVVAAIEKDLKERQLSYRAIAKKHGVHAKSVWKISKKLHLPQRVISPQKQETEYVSSQPTRTDEIKKDEWIVSLPKTRVHTLDELIKFCEVDTALWEVDRFICNKWEVAVKVNDGKDISHVETEALYQVKAWLKKKKVQAFILDEIADLKRLAGTYSPSFPAIIKGRSSGPSGNVVEHAMYDHHFGGLIWGKETGGADWDLELADETWRTALTTSIQRTAAFEPEGSLFVVGQDLMNSDNKAGTTERGTRQDMDSRYQKVYEVAKKAVVWAIDQQLDHYGKVYVPVVCGNHDPLATWHLGDYLSALYRKSKNVTVDNAPNFRKYWEFGVNMLMFSHGNAKCKLEDYGSTMAAEQPAMWGRTLWREAHTGDKHQRRTIEGKGFTVRILTTLRPPCAWTAEQMYQSMRVAESLIWNRTAGLIGSTNYSILPNRGK